MTSACYILRLESSVKSSEAEVLNAVTQASVAVLSVLWAAWDIYTAGTPNPGNRALEQLASMTPHWMEMCYLGIFCTAVCGWLQVRPPPICGLRRRQRSATVQSPSS